MSVLASPEEPIARPDARGTIVFIHVPKSAGTAFARYLQANCGAPERAMLRFYGDYSIYDDVEDVPLVAAHALYREMSPYFPGASFVTWLRHPVARAISQYKSWHKPSNLGRHWLEGMPHERFEHIRFAQQATFEEFVFSDDPRVINNLRNVYTGMLSSRWIENPAALASAKENLVSAFRFFGLVERFDDSMALFRDAFGWTAGFQEEPLYANRSKQDVRPSLRTIERLMELNKLDMQLYDFACLLFEDRLRQVRIGRGRRAAA